MTTQSLLIIILTAAALSTTVGTLLGVVTGFVMVLRASKEAGPPEQTAPLAYWQACDEERLRNAKD